jgi:hypothetical protein
VSTMCDNEAHRGPANNADDTPAHRNSCAPTMDGCPLCNSRGYKVELHSNHIYICACPFGRKLQNGLAELARNSAK